MGVHVFPILKLPPTSLPIPSLWVIPVHQPQASCIMHWTWTGDSFHIWQFTCFNAILPYHLTLALSHRVQNTVQYICVSLALSQVYTYFLICFHRLEHVVFGHPLWKKKTKHSLSRRGFFLHLFYKDPPFTQKIISDFNTIQWHHRPKFSWRVAGNSHFASTDLNYWKDALISWIAYNHNTQVNHFFQQNITECLLHRPHNQPPTP